MPNNGFGHALFSDRRPKAHKRSNTTRKPRVQEIADGRSTTSRDPPAGCFSNPMPAPLHPLFSFVVNLTGQRATWCPTTLRSRRHGSDVSFLKIRHRQPGSLRLLIEAGRGVRNPGVKAESEFLEIGRRRSRGAPTLTPGHAPPLPPLGRTHWVSSPFSVHAALVGGVYKCPSCR